MNEKVNTDQWRWRLWLCVCPYSKHGRHTVHDTHSACTDPAWGHDVEGQGYAVIQCTLGVRICMSI